MQAVTARDALNDPHQTIGLWKDPLNKSPDCNMNELNKRGTVKHDLKSKAIRDS